MKTLLILITILESLLSALSTRTLQSQISLSIGSDPTQTMTYNGSITMRAECFRTQMMGYDVAYDGKTLYMYAEDVNELTLSNPTDHELLEANPFLYAKALRDVCNITERANQENTQTIITLTPKDQSIGIQRFVLRVRNSDLLPLSIEVKEGKQMTTLRLKNPTWLSAAPGTTSAAGAPSTDAASSAWTITPPPDAFLNDLR